MDIKEIIKNVNWRSIHKRSRSPFFCQLFLCSIGVRNEITPFDNRLKYAGSFFDTVALDENEIKRIRTQTIDELKIDSKFLLRVMDSAYIKHDVSLKKWKEIAKIDFSKKSDAELKSILEEYTEDILSFGIYVSLPLFVEDYIDNFITEEFGKIFNENAKKWYNFAVNPVKEASVLQEEISLLNLAIHFDENKFKDHI